MSFNRGMSHITIMEFVLYDSSNVPIEVGYYLYSADKYMFNINSIEFVFD